MTGQGTPVKRYEVAVQDGEHMVTLEVDHAKLTVATATEVNSFWSNAADRIAQSGGDVVKAVIRLVGVYAIGEMLRQGGADFSGSGGSSSVASDLWSKDLRAIEGLGGEDGTPFGWCGVRIVEAFVATPSYDDVRLTEVAA